MRRLCVLLAALLPACSTMEHDKCTEVEEELIQNFLKKLGYKEVGELTPLLVTESINS